MEKEKYEREEMSGAEKESKGDWVRTTQKTQKRETDSEEDEAGRVSGVNARNTRRY